MGCGLQRQSRGGDHAGGTPKADHTFVLLENFFDELRRRVPLEK
jgi:hypothetical protein